MLEEGYTLEDTRKAEELWDMAVASMKARNPFEESNENRDEPREDLRNLDITESFFSLDDEIVEISEAGLFALPNPHKDENAQDYRYYSKVQFKANEWRTLIFQGATGGEIRRILAQDTGVVLAGVEVNDATRPALSEPATQTLSAKGPVERTNMHSQSPSVRQRVAPNSLRHQSLGFLEAQPSNSLPLPAFQIHPPPTSSPPVNTNLEQDAEKKLDDTGMGELNNIIIEVLEDISEVLEGISEDELDNMLTNFYDGPIVEPRYTLRGRVSKKSK